jgi:hypothetical protein
LRELPDVVRIEGLIVDRRSGVCHGSVRRGTQKKTGRPQNPDDLSQEFVVVCNMLNRFQADGHIVLVVSG